MPIRLANNCLLTRFGLMSLILTSAVTTAAAQSADPSRLLTLEEMQSGFVAAPIFKLTEVDGEIGTLAGFRLGELTDGRVFIGGAANWLVSGSSDVDLAYGGGLVEWFSHPDAPVQASVGSLVGIGSASLNTVVDVGALTRDGDRHVGDLDSMVDPEPRRRRYSDSASRSLSPSPRPASS